MSTLFEIKRFDHSAHNAAVSVHKRNNSVDTEMDMLAGLAPVADQAYTAADMEEGQGQ